MHISQEGIIAVNKFYKQYCEQEALDCDGATNIISTFLHDNGVEHTTKAGIVRLKDFEFAPHFWIEIGSLVIDFKLRKWFGDSPDIPHGVFNPSKMNVQYEGEEFYFTDNARSAMRLVLGYNGDKRH